MWRLSGTWGDFGAPLRHRGLHFGTLGVQFGVFLALWGTSGCHFSTLGLHLGTLGLHFGALLALWGVALDLFGHFWGKGSKKVLQIIQNGSQHGNIFDDILSFCGKWQTAFGLRLPTPNAHRATCFHPLALPFEHLVLALIFH